MTKNIENKTFPRELVIFGVFNKLRGLVKGFDKEIILAVGHSLGSLKMYHIHNSVTWAYLRPHLDSEESLHGRLVLQYVVGGPSKGF